MNKFALDVEKIKSDKLYYYETLSAMFLHYSYKHIISNVIFAFFIMYEIESCWKWGIPVSLVAGFAANSLAIATMEGILMGFSGVLCACVGVELAALILHCSYLRTTYGTQFYMMFFFCVMMIIMVMGVSTSALVHFYGLFFGLIFGLTLYPRMEVVNINENIDKVFKIFSAGFLGLAILLGLIV
jgi:membrane associated rhomboid family serine protease